MDDVGTVVGYMNNGDCWSRWCIIMRLVAMVEIGQVSVASCSLCSTIVQDMSDHNSVPITQHIYI